MSTPLRSGCMRRKPVPSILGARMCSLLTPGTAGLSKKPHSCADFCTVPADVDLGCTSAAEPRLEGRAEAVQLSGAPTCLQEGWTPEDSTILAQLLQPSEPGVTPLRAPLLLVRNKVDLAGVLAAAPRPQLQEAFVLPAAAQRRAAAVTPASAGGGTDSADTLCNPAAPLEQQQQQQPQQPQPQGDQQWPADATRSPVPHTASAGQAPAAWDAQELRGVLSALSAERQHSSSSARVDSSSASRAQTRAAGVRPWYGGRCVETSAAQLQGLPELMHSLEAIMGGGQLATGVPPSPCCFSPGHMSRAGAYACPCSR